MASATAALNSASVASGAVPQQLCPDALPPHGCAPERRQALQLQAFLMICVHGPALDRIPLPAAANLLFKWAWVAHAMARMLTDAQKY